MTDNDAVKALDDILTDIEINHGAIFKDHIQKIKTIRTALTKSAKVDGLLEALEIIAKRPDLPNPERDADWKNCMKWSSHEARQAIQRFNGEV